MYNKKILSSFINVFLDAFYSFFAQSHQYIKTNIKYYIKTTLKSHFVFKYMTYGFFKRFINTLYVIKIDHKRISKEYLLQEREKMR